MGLKDDLIAKAKGDFNDSLDSKEDSFDDIREELFKEEQPKQVLDFNEEFNPYKETQNDDFSFISENQSFFNESNNKEQQTHTQHAETRNQNTFEEQRIQQSVNQEQAYNWQPPSKEEEFHERSVRNEVNDSANEIKESLLMLAKKTVLDDISDNFESAIFTSISKKNIIDSYLTSKRAHYSNNNALFLSLLDEVKSSDYIHEYYKDHTDNIIDAIKLDIT